MIGLYGLIGAGRSEFVQSVFGRFPKTGGQIFWKGKPVEIKREKMPSGSASRWCRKVAAIRAFA